MKPSQNYINYLYQTVKKVTGFEGELEFDMVKPDGMPIKVHNFGGLNELGWAEATSFHTEVDPKSRTVFLMS